MSKILKELQLRIRSGSALSWVRTSEPERTVNAVMDSLQELRAKMTDQGKEPPKMILVIPHKGAYQKNEEDGQLMKIWPVEISSPTTGTTQTPSIPSADSWLDMLSYNNDSELENEPLFSFPQNAWIIVTQAADLFLGIENKSSIAKLEFRCSPPINALDGSPVQAMNSEESGRQIIFIGTNPAMIPATEQVARFMHIEEFKRPNVNEISEAIALEFPEGNELNIQTEDIKSAAEMLRGLTLVEAREAALFSVVKSHKLDPHILLEETRRMIERHPAITMPKFNETWEGLIGLTNAKKYLEKGFDPMTNPIFSPKGILLTGIPGAGKSHLAKALGHRLGIPTIQVNMGRIFGSLIGQTEKQLEDMFQILDGIGRAVILIDEIEKAFGGMNDAAGDGGISRRVGGTFLNWMQDRTGHSIIMGTSNDLSKLPAELTRQGRWSATFFVNYPSAEERERIGELYCKMWNVTSSPGYFAKECEQWTGSEIKDLISTAAMFGGETTSISEARQFITPLYTANPEKIKDIQEKGSVYTTA